jgi:hypothetical protein
MTHVGSIPGDPYSVAVSTTTPTTITLWLEGGDTTDLSRDDAERLAGLLMAAVRCLGG